MNKEVLKILLVVVMCGSAVCRPAQAYFSSQTSFTAQLETADWQAPSTQLLLNQQSVAGTDAQIDVDWFDCSTLESAVEDLPGQGIRIEAGELPVCITKNLSFALHQQRTISFKYQLFAAPVVKLEKQPLVRFYWNDAEIAWLSRTTATSSWLSLTIPESAETGKLSIKVVPVDLQIDATQLIIESLTFQRIVVTPANEITITSDEVQTAVFFSIDNSTELKSGQTPISISVSDLNQTGTLTFWSVDSWGNTETPKTIEYQVISRQADSPKILWQHYQDSKLHLVVEANEPRNVLVKQYQLITDGGELLSQLDQPWISSTKELYQPGIPVSVFFFIPGGIHAGRVQSVDQFGNESLASNLILF